MCPIAHRQSHLCNVILGAYWAVLASLQTHRLRYHDTNRLISNLLCLFRKLRQCGGWPSATNINCELDRNGMPLWCNRSRLATLCGLNTALLPSNGSCIYRRKKCLFILGALMIHKNKIFFFFLIKVPKGGKKWCLRVDFRGEICHI